MFQREGKMDKLLIVFLSTFCLNFANVIEVSDVATPAEAVGKLAHETLIAMSSFLTNCNKVPIQNPFNRSKNTFSILGCISIIDCLQGGIAEITLRM